MGRFFQIQPASRILIEGVTCSPADILGDIEIVADIPPRDLIAHIHLGSLRLVEVDQVGQPVVDSATAAAAAMPPPTRPDWYQQREQANAADSSVTDDVVTDDESSDDDSITTPASTATDPTAEPADPTDAPPLPIDLPKTVLAALARQKIKTLQDASEWLIENNGDADGLGISSKATATLLKQLADAGLPITEPT